MRLIDADALRDDMQWSIDHDMYDKPYDYLAEIDDAPTVGEWIPCSERLPKGGEHRDDMVLVCYRNGSVRFNTCMNGEWVQGSPIAWMPLPKPYKGGEDE